MGVIFLAGLLIALAGCEAPPARRTFVFEGPTMGTVYQVKVVRETLPEARRRQLERAINAELDGVNAGMSTWRDDSELSRFNRHAETTPFAVSAATYEVFRAALAVSRLSGGALDVTVEPLVEAWGFGAGAPEEPPPAPSDAELAALRERVGYRKLELLAGAPAIRKRRGDLRCDLSAVAKGYAVDRVAEALAALGESNFLVEVGGEVRAAGGNEEGRPWRIGIERPQLVRGGVHKGAVHKVVPLTAMALATSGDYRNYRELDGRRISHLLDPRTGRPIDHRLASVTVAHAACVMADAWATALMVLGPEDAFELAARQKLAALLLIRDGDGFRELATPAFEELLTIP